MPAPRFALSLMLEDDFRAAAIPLFEAGIVDALEWSFDIGWIRGEVPGWANALLDHYADANRLYGHGVTYSPLSARWEERQARWLERLGEECARRDYVLISEHFGFMTTPAFRDGAPLPVPYTPGALAVGRDRLARLREASGGLPVGLENLALALGPQDVDEQGCFLEALLEPDGFLLLDLHNLYCQAKNFARDPLALMESYPLDRVRALHLSGGSWWPGDAPFRRDTHDHGIPAEVQALLRPALERCPQVEVVVHERLGGTLRDPSEQATFRLQAEELREILQ